MTELSELFALPGLAESRRHRIARINELLGNHDQGSDAITYALAHHLLEGAEAAARAGDLARFDWYAEGADGAARLTMPSVLGPRVVLAPSLDELQPTEFSDTPCVLLSPEVRSPTSFQKTMVSQALRHAADAGFQRLLSEHAAVICLLRQQSLTDTFASWAVSRLPGTVFTDYSKYPEVLARDLIHEAGHNWLNDAFACTLPPLDSDATFYSPWKATHRPLFGFLHACWAFPLTMLYVERARTSASPETHAHLDTYLTKQRELLTSTIADHERALRLVPDDALRTRLREVHSQALGAPT